MRSVVLSQWQILAALVVAACLSVPLVSSTSDLTQFLLLSLEPMAVTTVGIRSGNRRLAATFSALGACTYLVILWIGVSEALPELDPLRLLWIAAISPLLAGAAITSIGNSLLLWRAQKQPLQLKTTSHVPFEGASSAIGSHDPNQSGTAPRSFTIAPQAEGSRPACST